MLQPVRTPDPSGAVPLTPASAAIPVWAWALWMLPIGVWLALLPMIPTIDLFRLLNHMTSRAPDEVWVIFNFLGNGWSLFAIVSPVLVFAPRVMLSGLCAGAVAGILSRSLKMILEMPRPAGVLDPASFHIIGKPLTSMAMPSGHTLTAFAIATAFFFSIAPGRRAKFAWLFVLAALAGIARIGVGAHWPSDVMVGSAIGLFSGVAGASIARRAPAQWLLPTSWLLWVLAAGALLCGYILATSEIDFPLARAFQPVGIAVVAITLILFARQALRARQR
ncbi:MAG: phosphatase PAP2 family protein [Burkholderiaceae bacterium]|nr:phosphatase PAP2 family protein [Burkholderiaceae bacterium]